MLLLLGRLSRFSALAPADRGRALERLQTHPIPLFRTLFQGVRRIVIASYYAHPAAHPDIGYRGPYHQRGPVVSWEGPLPGSTRDDEPVVRTADRSTVPSPPSVEFRDSTPTTTGQRIIADAVIIGSGAGGATAAARLAEAGLQVVVLERGDLVPYGEMTEEEGSMTPRMYADAGARSTDDLSFSVLQGETMGGSTALNWLVMLRTPDWVLDEWARDHGTEGLDPTSMRAVFDRIESEVHARLVPDDAHSVNNALLLRGARALGWDAAAARISARNCYRTGLCGGGCRYGARQGPMAVYLPRAYRAGARIFANATADRIEIVKDGSSFPTKRVHCTLGAGSAARGVIFEAPIVVAAGGAVQTPVLLQRSRLGSAAVGRYLRLHPTTAVFGLHDQEVYPAAGIPLSVAVDQFLKDGPRGYGFWLECPPVHPGLAAIAVPGFGSQHREILLQSRRLSAFIALIRDGGGADVSQGSVQLARSGRIGMRFSLSDVDRELLRRSIEAAARVQLAAGASEAFTLHARRHVAKDEASLQAIRSLSYAPNMLGLFSAHVNGTCRMGRKRATAACDPNGELFDAPGVFVFDGSLLPTAPGVNPQETIFALSTVLAERLAERFRARFTGA